MFHFPAFPPPPYTRSDDGGPAQPGPGSPIRTPPDQSSLANSPGHIAGRNVLHQLLVPRHPPNAPQNHTQQKTRPRPPPQRAAPRATRPPTRPTANAGQNKKGGRAQTTKMLATTIQITNNPPQPPQPHNEGRIPAEGPNPTHPPTKTGGGPPPKEGATTPHRSRRRHPPTGGATGVGREPDSAPVRPQQQSPHAQPHNEDAPHQHTASRTHAPPSTAPPPAPTPRTKRTTRTNGQAAPRTGLPRKEVIQPHLPVRLPCYDFVPIADPTFDHSPQQEPVGPWASGVTNFRDVTGGVYKARERIHRSVADLRLLATPPSWGRVADPNPN